MTSATEWRGSRAGGRGAAPRGGGGPPPGPLPAEAADDVGDGVAVLADGEAGQLDAGGPVPLAGQPGVEGIMDVDGHRLGLPGRERAGGAFRHGLADDVGQLGDGAVAFEAL